jgi:hypothetical protein
MKNQKKSKITYHKDIYPANFVHAKGMVWVFTMFIGAGPMPVMICAWQTAQDPVVAMFHQSLQ